MEKIFKKSLALVLSAALCLTALVGCLTVSADETTTPIVAGNYEVKDAEGVVGKTAEIFADYTDISKICAHWVEVTFPKGIKVNAVSKGKISISEDSTDMVTTWEPLTAYSSDNNGWDYRLTENEDGSTVVQSCEIVNFIKADGSYDGGEKNAELHFKFDVTIDKDLKPGAYNVTVVVKQAATQDEKWVDPATDDGVITVKADEPAHEHKWDAGVMTTMPTTTSNGVITYTCSGCEETKTEDFVVKGAVNQLDSQTFIRVSDIRIQYGATITASTIKNISSQSNVTVTGYGILYTTDGSEPVYSIPVKGSDESYTVPANVVDLKVAGAYKGMNFTQMGQTISFRAYLKFRRGEQECYYYGPTYSKIFIDNISSLTDPQAVALVSLYNNKKTATNITGTCTPTVAEEGDQRITLYAKNNKFDMLNERIQFAAQIGSAVLQEIVDNGGTLKNYGVVFSSNGEIPTAPDYIGSTKPIANNSTSQLTIADAFKGMNISQMSSSIYMRAYVQYEDASGNTNYVYSSAYGFVLMDYLEDYTSTNSYAAELVTYYNSYINK